MVICLQEGYDQLDRNERLLNSLLLRTSLTFRRFRNVLLKSGHQFLADLLWEEDQDTSVLDESILQRFPIVFDKLSDDTKKKLVLLIDSKVREKALQIAWRTSSIDRAAILHSRSSDFKQEKSLRDTIEEHEKQLAFIKNEMVSKDERIRLLTIENQGVKKEVDLIKQGHKKELEKQTNFNSANNSTIMRLKERFVSFNDIVVQLNREVRNYLGDESDSYIDDDDTKLSYLELNLKRVLQNAKSAEKRTESFSKQKQEIAMLLGKPGSSALPKELLEEFLEREKKSKVSLWRDIEKLADTIRGLPKTGILQKRISNDSMATDNRFLRNYLATLKAEVEHLHKRMLWKDNHIRELKSELESYKQQLPKIRRGSKTPPPSPESTYVMDAAYSKLNSYIMPEASEDGVITTLENGQGGFGLETYQDIPQSSKFFSRSRKSRRVVFSDISKDAPTNNQSPGFRNHDPTGLPRV